jgi:hypothetical protein
MEGSNCDFFSAKPCKNAGENNSTYIFLFAVNLLLLRESLNNLSFYLCFFARLCTPALLIRAELGRTLPGISNCSPEIIKHNRIALSRQPAVESSVTDGEKRQNKSIISVKHLRSVKI